MFTYFLSEKTVMAVASVVTPLLCAILLALFSGKLPKDQGREFAVDGEKSAGKIRGAGLLFVISFIICGLLFVRIKVEYLFYYFLILCGMLSGYLDDRSDKPWNEYKKGIIDLVISLGTALTFTLFNTNKLFLGIFGFRFHVFSVIYVILGTVLVWMLINAVNCSDGIDGFSSVLTGVSYISAAAVIIIRHEDLNMVTLTVILILTLLPYLWKNAQPSTMMMGDAGSRALGLFLAILIMKTGNMLLVIPLCLVVCFDGLLGIAKVSMIRFLHLNVMKKIRTPLHDHCRKNLGWSNTQVIYRFVILQAIVSVFAIMTMK